MVYWDNKTRSTVSQLNMGKKGITSSRGVGEIYSETKTEQVVVVMTRTGRTMLDSLAKAHGLTRSELFEQIARRHIVLIPRTSSTSHFSRPSQIRRLIFMLSRSYMPPNP